MYLCINRVWNNNLQGLICSQTNPANPMMFVRAMTLSPIKVKSNYLF